MLNTIARAAFTRLFRPLARLLLRLGLTPDAVTYIGTIGVCAGALVFYPLGHLFWGTVVITVFVFCDMLDGIMARETGRNSLWGAFLDSTLDRIADSAVFIGSHCVLPRRRRSAHRAARTRVLGDRLDRVLCAGAG